MLTPRTTLSLAANVVAAVACAGLAGAAPREAEVEAPPLEQWSYQARVTLLSRSTPYLAGARADFTLLLQRAADRRALDPDSIRVVEQLPDGTPSDFLPVRFAPDAGFDAQRNATGIVLWQVSPTPAARSERTFLVCYDTVRPRRRPLPSGPKLLETTPSLFCDGSFETADAEATNGWTGDKRWGAQRVRVQLSPATHALQLRPGQDGWGASIRTPGRPGVPIDPSQQYRLTFRYALEKDHPRGLQATLLWFGADRALLEQQRAAALTEATTGWRKLELLVTAPPNSSYVSVVFSTQCRTGYVYLDDLAFAPAVLPTVAPVGGFPPPAEARPTRVPTLETIEVE